MLRVPCLSARVLRTATARTPGPEPKRLPSRSSPGSTERTSFGSTLTDDGANADQEVHRRRSDPDLPLPRWRSQKALTEIRAVALEAIGDSGEHTIDKQYAGTRSLIEQGAGFEAIRTMVEQHSKAITLLKGRDVAAMFDEQVQPLLGDADRAPVAVTNNQGGTNS